METGILSICRLNDLNLLNKNSRTLIKYNADKRNGSSDGESTPGHYEGGAFGQNISKIPHKKMFGKRKMNQ